MPMYRRCCCRGGLLKARRLLQGEHPRGIHVEQLKLRSQQPDRVNIELALAQQVQHHKIGQVHNAIIGAQRLGQLKLLWVHWRRNRLALGINHVALDEDLQVRGWSSQEVKSVQFIGLLASEEMFCSRRGSHPCELAQRECEEGNAKETVDADEDGIVGRQDALEPSQVKSSEAT